MMNRCALVLTVLCLVVGCSATGTSDSDPVAAGTDEVAGTDAGVESTSERDQAVAELMAEAFLPERAAACVVDTAFFEAGVYDITSEQAQSKMDQAAVIEKCTELAVEATGSVELTADMLPSISPGGMASGTVTIDNTTIEYVTVTPLGFEPGDLAPVFLAFPPGGQDLEITQNVTQAVYLQQAVARGWVVVSPASPQGRWYDDANAGLATAFSQWVAQWVTVEGGKPHLGGMSNGGTTAFNVAAQNPAGYRSLLAYPGVPRNEDGAVLDQLGDIPVRLWVGGEDTTWVRAMESATEQMQAKGIDVKLTVLPGEPHIIQSIANGVLIFNELDAARG